MQIEPGASTVAGRQQWFAVLMYSQDGFLPKSETLSDFSFILADLTTSYCELTVYVGKTYSRVPV